MAKDTLFDVFLVFRTSCFRKRPLAVILYAFILKPAPLNIFYVMFNLKISEIDQNSLLNIWIKKDLLEVIVMPWR